MASASRAVPIRHPDSRKKTTANSAFNDEKTTPKSIELPKAQPKRVLEPGAGKDNVEAGLSIYARTFVPEILTVINTLPPLGVHSTIPRKAINFAAYVDRSFGSFATSLPSLPLLTFDFQTNSRGSLHNAKEYEEFFQFHLREELKSQQAQNEGYSLYGHEVAIKPSSRDFRSFQNQGETICSLRVPGIRDNSPLIEEDDIVHLRQLVYGQDGSPLHMREWLEWTKATRHTGSTPHQGHMFKRGSPAPGWTNVLFAARVLSVSRANELLILRASGLPGVFPTERTERFNVQFPYPVERYLPMQYALPIVRHGLSQLGEYQELGGSLMDSGTSRLVDPTVEQPVHWIQSMLFPTLRDSRMQEKLHAGQFRQKFFDQVLNWEQKKAVEAVCEGKYGKLPYLISGPPGTGKTKTIIETALQLLKNSSTHGHILMCAPSDPAADTLVHRLQQHLKTSEMLRLNRPGRTFAEVPGAVLPYCSIVNDAFTLPDFHELMKYRVVITTCRDSSLLVRARATNSDLYMMEDALRRLTRSFHPLDSASESTKLHWSALLIDEAAQATEPEALTPLAVVAPHLSSPETLSPLFVMAGDEHQLGPRTLLPDSPLKISLFARLFKRGVYAEHPLARGKPLTQSLLPIPCPAFASLKRNYRSHPAILAVPSSLFYADDLEPEASDTNRLTDWDGWRGRRWPVIFHDNASQDELELPGLIQGTGGWFNAGEAEIACQYAASLVASGLVEQSEVCIMSPFKAQVQRLRKRMRDRHLWDVNIGPLEAFQGLERAVVILCVTRSRAKFLDEDQRMGWGVIDTPDKMNVALTRAKSGLIVVGRRELLVEDPNWKAFVDYCERNGLTGGGGEPKGEDTRDDKSHQRTRLEKILIEQERNSKLQPVDEGWGQSYGLDTDQEMWTTGMVEAPPEFPSHGY
ncbi:P-loop containing nucleoside triphosphate hydrolase protein [Diaporthe sp. PMI_573]|nr:P-loop containing nucleoside triphosphate hydrolase protein [Diaporthaceae sp. PMI_573]